MDGWISVRRGDGGVAGPEARVRRSCCENVGQRSSKACRCVRPSGSRRRCLSSETLSPLPSPRLTGIFFSFAELFFFFSRHEKDSSRYDYMKNNEKACSPGGRKGGRGVMGKWEGAIRRDRSAHVNQHGPVRVLHTSNPCCSASREKLTLTPLTSSPRRSTIVFFFTHHPNSACSTYVRNLCG